LAIYHPFSPFLSSTGQTPLNLLFLWWWASNKITKKCLFLWAAYKIYYFRVQKVL
jgi:hypothetical protein